MKKLVCASEVKAAAEKGQKTLCIDNNTILTPSAKDLAKELGVEFTLSSAPVGNSCCQSNKQQGSIKPELPLDRELIYQVVKAILCNQVTPPFLSTGDKQSGLKIVRGQSVQYENFDTGKPNTQVAYREVISKDESQMSAGFLTIDKSSFDWELSYEEIDVVLEGSLSITINGKTYEACQGDVLFVPKGSKVSWSSPGHVKLFYVTYPANWPDLLAR